MKCKECNSENTKQNKGELAICGDCGNQWEHEAQR